MLYRQDIDGCLAETPGPDGFGAGRLRSGGLGNGALAEALAQAGAGLAKLRAWHDDGSLPLLHLPARRDDLPACRDLAAAFRERFDDVILLGTGGSSLGGQTLYGLAERGFGPPPGSPRLHFMDNVDPDTFAALGAALDPARTGLIAISKSGSTAETVTQLLVLLPWLRDAVGEAGLPDRIAAVTEPKDNPLRALATRHGLPCLEHDPGVGGRFSVLSVTGVLPALLAGLDVEALRDGAGDVLERTLAATDPGAAAPALGAAVQIALRRGQGIGTSVLMPYLDRLDRFGLWYCQLWAESLGKDGAGTTPIKARGTVDQHSQLQLYLAGPRDKLFTLLLMDTSGQGTAVAPASVADPGLAYLKDRGLGDLLDAMGRATAETLIENGRPTRRFVIERLDEAVLGALLMHFMLETVIAAELLGVNAFDQPAVEESKVLARRYLAEMGAEAR